MRSGTATFVVLACVMTAACSTVNLRDTAAKPRVDGKDRELAERYLAHWNTNSAQLRSVVCDRVDIEGKSEGQPYSLDAKIAYQEPQNFRLTGDFLGKSEADLGSNGQEVWFWVARSKPPTVYFCKREDLEHVTLPMPFHPDDLIEVLGAVNLDPKQYKFERGFEYYVTLIAAQTAPDGNPVVKRIVFDRNTGRIHAFQVWDMLGGDHRLLAEAIIHDYHEDPSGVFVPKKVQLKLPEAKTNLTLTMRSRAIQINAVDPQWAMSLFRRSNYIGTQEVDLGEEYRRRQAMMNDPQYAKMTPVSRHREADVPQPYPDQGPPPVALTSEDRAPRAAQIQPIEPTEANLQSASPAYEPFANIHPGGYHEAGQNSRKGASLTGTIERASATQYSNP